MARPPHSPAYPQGHPDPQRFVNYAQMINQVQATGNVPPTTLQSSGGVKPEYGNLAAQTDHNGQAPGNLGNYESASPSDLLKPTPMQQYSQLRQNSARGPMSTPAYHAHNPMSPEQDDDDDMNDADGTDLENSQAAKKRKMSETNHTSTNDPKPTAPSKEKRRRQVQSCSECRRRKIKCDKKFPCGPCTLRNDQSICREVEKHTPTATGCASTNDLLNLQHRLSVLESLLAEAGIIAPGTLDELTANPNNKNNKMSTAAVGTSVTAAGVPKREPSGTHTAQGYAALTDQGKQDNEGDSDTEGAALTLEHLAFGQRKLSQLTAVGVGMTQFPPAAGSREEIAAPPSTGEGLINKAGGDFARRNSVNPNDLSSVDVNTANNVGFSSLPPNLALFKQNLHRPVNTALLNALDPSEVFSIFYQRSDVFVRALTHVSPDRKHGELLVYRYLERVEWLHRCLHVPTFIKQCQELWSLSQENIVQEVHTPFLGLYFIVMCVSARRVSPLETLIAQNSRLTQGSPLARSVLYGSKRSSRAFLARRSGYTARNLAHSGSSRELQCLFLIMTHLP